MRALVVSSMLVLVFAREAWPHSRQISPVPRSNSAGLKTPPCGGVAAGADPTKYQVLEVGKTYPMTLEETIQHPGHFIYTLLDRNGNKMADLVTVVDDINTGMKTVSVPMDAAKGVVTCDQCILQLMQKMEENPANPTYYYSCADVKIVPAGSNAPPLAAPPAGATSGATTAAAQCPGH